jgi:hypothetical protein
MLVPGEICVGFAQFLITHPFLRDVVIHSGGIITVMYLFPKGGQNRNIFFNIHQLKILSSKIISFECLLQPKQIDIQRKTEIVFTILPTLGK